MSDEEGGAGLRRLSTHINAARRLVQHERGKRLDPETADQIAGYLRAAQLLLRGREPEAPPAVQTGTRRFKLWQRDPRCLWCGRVTRIEGVHEQDAATLDHLRRKSQRARPSSLPGTVLACKECNHARGQPKARSPDACPVVRRAA